MIFHDNTDTICALSTPPGTGAIAVIRISGSRSFEVLNSIFRPAAKDLDMHHVASHTIHYGTIIEGDSIQDEVLVSVFRAPNSYTGEDVAEISCHGSVYVQQKIIELLLTTGLRMASPGEFTFRAFSNGKLDLIQAEAVTDLIASHSKTSHDLAVQQMRGGFSGKIRELRKALVDFTSLIELELDFSEEDVEFADRNALNTLLEKLLSETDSLIQSFKMGNVIKNGIPVAIIGKPNVGKSTLLNAILNEEKAIVSEIPGTTRDAIEDTIVIGGYSFRFIDTAGLRAAENKVETIGIERTWAKIGEASIILYVFDVTSQSFHDVMAEINEIKEITAEQSNHLVLVGNKTDQLQELPKGFKDFVALETIFVSGKRKENIHLLAAHLVSLVKKVNLSDRTIISNSRHYEALVRAHESIESVQTGLAEGIPTDLVTIDIRKALYHLGEITGEITTDEILDNIFSRFCIGK
ncbi:MAG TPA: tRNA uridine-5-carboxymethylaminomethyl(34) synthesis GTPase MnmE [Bacteroidales bacterium]|nr:tRNA uridine-5-carboxymethylaminomethyl(34) synthesis GTPase MnmE [Bacteroidales bacterium]HPS50908.1 tRNA uridine-5-carboxymethylaminomethyl(34) synthesis GTPase MnmE [Bacteroidales bacterium]